MSWNRVSQREKIPSCQALEWSVKTMSQTEKQSQDFTHFLQEYKHEVKQEKMPAPSFHFPPQKGTRSHLGEEIYVEGEGSQCISAQGAPNNRILLFYGPGGWRRERGRAMSGKVLSQRKEEFLQGPLIRRSRHKHLGRAMPMAPQLGGFPMGAFGLGMHVHVEVWLLRVGKRNEPLTTAPRRLWPRLIGE